MKVSAPEDILASKINRLICHSQKYGISPEKIDLGELKREREIIEAKRKELYLDYDRSMRKKNYSVSPERLASLRSNKDVYDIMVLDMSTNLDYQRLYNALVLWDIPNKLKKDKNLKTEIFEVTPEVVKKLVN